MKLHRWSGIALVLLAACGGGTAQTTTTTAPAATAVAVQPTEAATVEIVESPTVEATIEATMEMDTPTAEATMDMETSTAMTEMTAEATSATDETASTAGGNTGDPVAYQALVDAFDAQMTGGPFRATTTFTADADISILMTVEGSFIPPSRVDVGRKIGTQPRFRVIVIDDQMWSTSEGAWLTAPESVGPDQAAIIWNRMTSNSENPVEQITNAQAAGTADIDGITTNMYTYESEIEEEGTLYMDRTTVWVDSTTNLPTRIEIVRDDGSLIITQNITYDDTISIEPPV